MDNKTWLIQQIILSDMNEIAKTELVTMINPGKEERLKVKTGDILKPVGDPDLGVYTVAGLREVYGGRNQAIIYRHLYQDFFVFDEDYYTNPNYFEIVGHHEGGRMTWADG